MSGSTAVTRRAGPGARLRRHRGVTMLVLLVLTVVAVLTVLTGRSTVRAEDLDPDNPSPDGAQAVARVLAGHGVELTVVRRAAELQRTALDRATTLLVTSTDNLGGATARQVGRAAGTAGAVVLAAPSPTLVRALDLPLSPTAATAARSTPAGCDDPLLGGLTVDAGTTRGYRARGSAVVSCFPRRGRDAGALVVRVGGPSPTYAVAGTALLTNDRVDRADNAAAALRLLGQRDRLVWYVPDVRDVATGDTGSLAAQLPRGLVPALWLLGASVLATMLWRGRRLGPLVVEPLPVVVKAVESTQGRGRLYRRVRDRDHAARVLRAATSRRLTTHLRLPAGGDPDELVAAVARATASDPLAIRDLLVERPVTDDQGLARLAGDLSGLEREVHDS